jgi:hypothetical protein
MNSKRRLTCVAADYVPENEVMLYLFESGIYSTAEIADKLVDMIDLNDLMFTICVYVWHNEDLDEIMNLFDIKLYTDGDDETPRRLYRAQHPDATEEELQRVFENWADGDALAFSHLDGTDVHNLWQEHYWWDQFEDEVRHVTRENVAKALELAIPVIEDRDGFIRTLERYSYMQ